MCYNVSLVFFFLATCKHYDGIIMPEIKDKSFCAGDVGYVTRAKNAFLGFFGSKTAEKPSREQVLIDIKSLSQSDHVKLRKKALNSYLISLHDVLYGPESIDDPVHLIRTVYALYFSLHNSHVTYRYYNEQHEVAWQLQETANVRYKLLYMNENTHD